MLLMRTKPQCLPFSSLPSLTPLTLTSAPLWLLTSISELWIFSAALIVPHQGWNLNLILSHTLKIASSPFIPSHHRKALAVWYFSDSLLEPAITLGHAKREIAKRSSSPL